MAHSRKEASGLQRNGYNSRGESSNVEADPTSNSSPDMRHSPMLQGGHNGHPKVYDDMETRVDGVQRFTKEDGMEYGGGSHDEF